MLPRLVSHVARSLGAHVLRLLGDRHHTLEEFYTLTGAENIVRYPRTVNTRMTDDTFFEKLSIHLLSSAPEMKRLLIEGDTEASLHWPDQMNANVRPELSAPISQLQSLQDLIVRKRPLGRPDYFDCSKIVDFSAVRRLVLWRCYYSNASPLHELLAALGSHLGGQVLHLEHFAVDVHSEILIFFLFTCCSAYMNHTSPWPRCCRVVRSFGACI
jgi:hypothetical protein